MEETLARWGFKLTIRPIYGEPSSFLQSAIKEDKLKQIFLRVGGEE